MMMMKMMKMIVDGDENCSEPIDSLLDALAHVLLQFVDAISFYGFETKSKLKMNMSNWLCFSCK